MIGASWKKEKEQEQSQPQILEKSRQRWDQIKVSCNLYSAINPPEACL